MIGDLLKIVIEGFTIPKNSVHKIIFVKMCLVEYFKLNRSCLIISSCELIFDVMECGIT